MHAVNRTRQHGRSRPPQQRGFTLIEIVVVMVIIGIVIAGAIISLGATGRDSQLERERDRLAAIMAYVRERGAMLTLEYGILCGQHGYRFVFYDNRTMQWVPETVDDTLRSRRLPAGVHLELIIEGHPIVLDDKALKIRSSAAPPAGGNAAPLGNLPSSLDFAATTDTPQIMLFSNGDANSFVLSIVRDGINRSVSLRSIDDGSIKVSDILEPKP